MAGETPSPNGNPGPAGPEAPGKLPPSGPGAGVDLRERIDQMGLDLVADATSPIRQIGETQCLKL